MKLVKPNTSENYVTRIYIEDDLNSSNVSPLGVLREIFHFGTSQDLKEMASQLCNAGMSSTYSWTKSPGELLFIHCRLEKLVEACYLLISSSEKKGISKACVLNSTALNANSIPTLLTFEEYQNPIIVIKSIFKSISLKEWKQSLSLWLEASLSNYSIVEIEIPENIFGFPFHLSRLIDAASIVLNSSKS